MDRPLVTRVPPCVRRAVVESVSESRSQVRNGEQRKRVRAVGQGRQACRHPWSRGPLAFQALPPLGALYALSSPRHKPRFSLLPARVSPPPHQSPCCWWSLDLAVRCPGDRGRGGGGPAGGEQHLTHLAWGCVCADVAPCVQAGASASCTEQRGEPWVWCTFCPPSSTWSTSLFVCGWCCFLVGHGVFLNLDPIIPPLPSFWGLMGEKQLSPLVTGKG